MKKFFPIFIALIILYLSYQVIVNFFITHYTTDYSVVGEDNLFDITESFYDNGSYDFVVKDKDSNSFLFSDKLSFNKQKGVIKDIAYYSDKNIQCILPIYKRDMIGNISCIYQNTQVDYAYLITNNVPTENMLTKFKKYGYNVDKSINLDSKTKEYSIENRSPIYVYEDNVYDDYTYAIWNYNGIFFINKDKTGAKEYLDEDLYDNSNSRLVGKYYFIFNFTGGIMNDILYINMEDYGKNYIYLNKVINNNMYINGIYDNHLYLTDLKDKVQYSLNPYTESIEVVGQNSSFVIMNNNKLENIPKREFFSNKYYFNSISVDGINKRFGKVDVTESNNYYYFVKDNIFYKQNINHPGVYIKLFKFDGVTDWKVTDNDIIFTVGDMLYLFSEKYGIKPIARNNEFKFNYKNMCSLYKKS